MTVTQPTIPEARSSRIFSTFITMLIVFVVSFCVAGLAPQAAFAADGEESLIVSNDSDDTNAPNDDATEDIGVDSEGTGEVFSPANEESPTDSPLPNVNAYTDDSPIVEQDTVSETDEDATKVIVEEPVLATSSTVTNEEPEPLTYVSTQANVTELNSNNTRVSYTTKNGKVMISGNATQVANIVVTYGNQILKNGSDYTVSYLNNTKVGTATLVITGINNYAGTLSSTYTIVGAPSVTYGAKNMPVSSTSAWKLSNATWKIASGNAVTLTGTSAVKAVRQGSAVIEVYNLLNEKIGTQTVNVYPLQGRVMLRSANTSGSGAMYLDVSGQSKKDGGNIIIWKKNNGLNQQFTFKLQSDGSYTITCANSGKLVDVNGQSKKDGGNVIQWKANGGKNQRWNISVDANDRLTFTCVNSGKILDVSGASKKAGANVIQWKANGGLNQKWVVEAAPYKLVQGATEMPLSALSTWTVDNVTLKVVSGGVTISGSTVTATSVGKATIEAYDPFGKKIATKYVTVYNLGTDPYFIMSAGKSNIALDISGASTKAGGNAIIWTFNGQSNQMFSFERQSDGTYLIRSTNSGLLLEAAGSTSASKKNGANIDQGSKTVADNKKWYLVVDSSNKISFKNKRSGRLIDIDGAKYTAGRNIIQWNSNGGKNQKWTLSKVVFADVDLSNIGETLAWYACRYSYSRASYYGEGYTGTVLYQKVCKTAVYSKSHTTPGKSFTILSCDRGVVAAIKWTGVDLQFPNGVDNMCQYLVDSGQTQWKNLGYWDGKESSLKPGDVLIRQKGYTANCSANHVCMYVGNTIVTQVYNKYIKGTDGDRGTPVAGASWVGSHWSHGNLSKASAACIGNASYAGATTKQKMLVFRCVKSDGVTKYLTSIK